ncbi:MAG: zinc ribbon domain-containing protein [Christensenellaceae bacterium]|nr:zinc ribbon domain-containing protein [Christensenellaceae bacterium]
MFCTRCGGSVMPGAAYCQHCGQPMLPAPPQGYAAAPQGYAMPPYGPGAPQVKADRTGLILGIVSGAVALIVILVVLLFVWPGLLRPDYSVTGTWYSEERGEVIRFGPGRSFYAQTPYGNFEGRYSFNVRTGRGRIRMQDGRAFDFVVDGNRLLVDNIGVFRRADENFDVDGFLEDAG